MKKDIYVRPFSKFLENKLIAELKDSPTMNYLATFKYNGEKYLIMSSTMIDEETAIAAVEEQLASDRDFFFLIVFGILLIVLLLAGVALITHL